MTFSPCCLKTSTLKRQKFVLCNEKAEAKQLHDAVSTVLRLAQIKTTIKLQRKSHFCFCASSWNVSCVSPCCLKTSTLKEAKVCFVQQKSRNKTTARRCFHLFAPCTNQNNHQIATKKPLLFLCKQLECQLCFALLFENVHVERGKSLFRAMKQQKQNSCTTLFPPFCALRKSKQPSNCNEKITFVLVSVFAMTNLKV